MSRATQPPPANETCRACHHCRPFFAPGPDKNGAAVMPPPPRTSRQGQREAASAAARRGVHIRVYNTASVFMSCGRREELGENTMLGFCPLKNRHVLTASFEKYLGVLACMHTFREFSNSSRVEEFRLNVCNGTLVRKVPRCGCCCCKLNTLFSLGRRQPQACTSSIPDLPPAWIAHDRDARCSSIRQLNMNDREESQRACRLQHPSSIGVFCGRRIGIWTAFSPDQATKLRLTTKGKQAAHQAHHAGFHTSLIVLSLRHGCCISCRANRRRRTPGLQQWGCRAHLQGGYIFIPSYCAPIANGVKAQPFVKLLSCAPTALEWGPGLR